MTTLKEATKKLMDVDRSSSTPEDIEQLLKDCWFKRHIPISILLLSEETKVYRLRIIKESETIQFEDELSYPPSKLNTKYQRASTPQFNVFYGISAPGHLDAFAGCLGETCDCFREDNPKSQQLSLVLSEWIATEDTKFISFLNPDTPMNKSSIFKQMTPDFNYLLKSAEKQTETSGITQFFEYLNKEYTKSTSTQADYWVTSKNAELILSNALIYDGVVYESTQAVDEKLTEVKCLAIRPESIDSKFEFEKATLYSLDFNSDTMEAVPRKIKELTITKREEKQH